MSYLHAIFLGLIQGITEFLPVSSSAHLQLSKMALGLSEVPLIFDLACHLGTLLALILFLREDIRDLFFNDHAKLGYLCIALIPLVPCLLFLAPLRKCAQNPQFLGLFLMGTGLILFLGQKLRIKTKNHFLRDVLLIGTAQSAALFPGISRSGATISCAQCLGWNVKEAVRFSFLLAIPTILGGNLIEARHLWKTKELSLFLSPLCLIGFTVSFIVGLFVIRRAMDLLENGKLARFAWYCLMLGLFANLILFWPR